VSEEPISSFSTTEPTPAFQEDLATAFEEEITNSTTTEPTPALEEVAVVASEEPISSAAAESTPVPEEVSVAASEEESVSIVSSVKSEENDSLQPNFTPARKGIGISNRALARRLGISSRAIAIWRSKPNFTQWSMTKDPEQIGWVYIKPLNKFYAVTEGAKHPR
jgi:DNA-binding transcriptional regulator YiaG